MAPQRLLLWLRNDLRLHDNPVFAEAVKRVQSGAAGEVLPVFIVDVRWFRDTKLGFFKTGALRSQFLLEAVNDLKAQLREIGSDLLVAVGKPEEVLPHLLVGGAGKAGGAVSGGAAGAAAAADARHPPSTAILFTREVTSEETNVDTKVRAACGSRAVMESVWGSTLIHLDDLPFDVKRMPDSFTPFRTKIESTSSTKEPRPLLPTPKRGQLPLPGSHGGSGGGGGGAAAAASSSPTFGPYSLSTTLTWDAIPVWSKTLAAPPPPDPRGVLHFKGGETQGIARLDYYVNRESKLVASYFDTRNEMLGGDYSTKFAPWLALGCLSPRLIYHRIKTFERTTGIANKSTYWVIFELLWRDFFRFYALKHGNAIFLPGGPIQTTQRWSRDLASFRLWVEGRTGAPLVDACMRELAATGFMSNRGRQNVASYLVHYMGLDWRLGAAYFESVLLDYDVCSNWGNWVALAGLTGGRLNIFNILKQSMDYDAEGKFVRHWIPELARVPGSLVHTPHRLTEGQQREYGVRLGIDYPASAMTSAGSTVASRFSGSGGSGGGGGGAAGSYDSRPRSSGGASGSGGGSRKHGGYYAYSGAGGRDGGGKAFKPKSDFERFG